VRSGNASVIRSRPRFQAADYTGRVPWLQSKGGDGRRSEGGERSRQYAAEKPPSTYNTCPVT